MTFNNAHIQTIINSIYPFISTNKGVNFLFEDSKSEKILVNYDIQDKDTAIAIIIHGWFGSYKSSIVDRYSSLLKKNKHGVVRINLKDHGETCKLNCSLFDFTDIHYVEEIIKHVISKYKKRIVLVGLSFGANILLRIDSDRFTNEIIKMILITPVFDIASAFSDIDKKKIYRYILHSKWKSMLRKKLFFFPDNFHLNSLFKSRSCNEIVHFLLPYMKFNAVDDYFLHCRVDFSRIHRIKFDTLILISENDPIISRKNIEYLEKDISSNKKIKMVLSESGGHCKFDKKILEL